MKYILTADWHLRETTPQAWTGEDFVKTQWDRVRQVYSIAQSIGAHVVIAGDIFHSWKCGFNLPFELNSIARGITFFIPGNHELPAHRWDEFQRSPCSALHPPRFHNVAETDDRHITGRWFGDTTPECLSTILVLHEMIWQSEPFPGADPAGNALSVLRRYEGQKCRLIVTGDNHQPFHVIRNGVHLVNCGPIIRQKASEIDIVPCVWVYDNEDHTVEKIELDYNPADISRDHISKREQIDNRLASFVESLGDLEASLDFEKNLQIAMDQASLSVGDREVIGQYIEQAKTAR